MESVLAFRCLLAMMITSLLVAAQEKTPAAARDRAYPPQLSGTVVDTSGAVIAGATVQVRGASGTVQITTHSDTDGYFIISGLSTGNYRLAVSNPDFATQEIPVIIGTTEAPTPPLRERWAQRKSKIVPFFVREKSWKRFPASSSLNTPAAARPTNIFFAASIWTTAQISPFSSTGCRLTCRRTRTARGTRT